MPVEELYHQLKDEGRIELNDDFLLTPIFANEAKVSEENNYSYNLTAKQLTRWRYWALLNFYAISYGMRPWRLASTVWNSLLGKETRIVASMPYREMRTFGQGLQGVSHGRGRFYGDFSHFELAPENLVPEAIASSPFRVGE